MIDQEFYELLEQVRELVKTSATSASGAMKPFVAWEERIDNEIRSAEAAGDEGKLATLRELERKLKDVLAQFATLMAAMTILDGAAEIPQLNMKINEANQRLEDLKDPETYAKSKDSP